MAIAALVCGILGLVGGFIPVVNYFTIVFSILGVVLGLKAKKALTAIGEPTGFATAGYILGIIGIASTVISTILVLLVFGGTASALAALV